MWAMKRDLLFFAGLATLLVSSQTQAGDWPNYLGSGYDGIVENESLRLDWKKNPPKTSWTRNVGLGCSSFAIVDGKALTLGNKDNKDTIWCFEATTGKLIWKREYSEPTDPKLYTGGPSATPAIDGNKVYSVSKSGKLFCLDLDSGEVLWSKDYSDDFQGRKPRWGWAASPRIHGDLLIIEMGAPGGAIMALNKNTQEMVWQTGDYRPGYATPVIFEYDQQKAVALFHSKELVAYNLDDADKTELFSFSWRTSYGVNSSTPHYHDGKFFLGSGYGSGYAVIDITKPEPEIIHRDRNLPLKLQTSILVDDRIIAVFGDDRMDAELISLNVDTGDIDWRYSLPGKSGNAIAVDDHLLVTTDSGHVVLGKADKNGFTELGRKSVLLGLAWAPPAFANGHLYFRNNQGKAVCLDISDS